MADWRLTARPVLSAALQEKDQEAFELALVQLLGVAREDEISTFAYELLDDMHHDIQTWWRAECNCDGHLN